MTTEELRKRVKRASELPQNSKCADCLCKLTTSSIWASSTLGVFICINCSGRHRNLGTHITFIRSVTLDTWTEQQVYTMENIGNDISNQYWEKFLPSDFIRPKTDDLEGLQKFIRMKYELKKWADKSTKPPHELLRDGVVPQKNVTQSQSTDFIQQQQVQQPYQGGFAKSNSVDVLGGLQVQQSPSPQSGGGSLDFLFGDQQQPQQSSSQNTVDIFDLISGGSGVQQQTSYNSFAQQASKSQGFGLPPPPGDQRKQTQPNRQTSFGTSQQNQTFNFSSQPFGFPQQSFQQNNSNSFGSASTGMGTQQQQNFQNIFAQQTPKSRGFGLPPPPGDNRRQTLPNQQNYFANPQQQQRPRADPREGLFEILDRTKPQCYCPPPKTNTPKPQGSR